MDPKLNFKWVKSAPGVWVRDVDEVEKAYSAMAKLYKASGRMFFAITGHLQLKLDGPGGDRYFDQALQTAWETLRRAEPALATQIEIDQEKGKFIKVYRHNPKDWWEKTIKFISTHQTGAEWANNDPPAPLLPTLFVLKTSDPTRRDLVFRSPHDILDGIGTLMMLGKYARLVSVLGEDYTTESTLEDDFNHQSLPPPFRVAARIPDVASETVQAKLAERAKDQSNKDESRQTLSIPYKHGEQLPGVHKRVALTFTKADTARILAACQAAQVTVTHVFHAALAMVLRDLQEPASEDTEVVYDGYILRNERHQCSEPFNGPEFAITVMHSVSGDRLVVPMTIPGKSNSKAADKQARVTEFLRVVEVVKAFYEKVRKDKDHYLVAPYIWAALTPDLGPDLGADLPVPGPKSNPSVSISSMGNMDKLIPQQCGNIHVYDPWVTGEELGNGLGLFLGTFRDELCLSAAYNDAWQDRDGVTDFLNRCEGLVREGLSL